MTKEEFKLFWSTTYPKTQPISHLFKDDYSDRWFRIHSLPESKRYAETTDEWTLLLSRHNQIITDLFGANSKVLLVTGEYNWGENRSAYITDEELVFRQYHFIPMDNIDLFQLNNEDYDEHEIYRPAFAETNWNAGQHDNLLREIASDNARAFFISPQKEIIVAPYDGGIDFILKDPNQRDHYKNIYKDWLSFREDGL